MLAQIPRLHFCCNHDHGQRSMLNSTLSIWLQLCVACAAVMDIPAPAAAPSQSGRLPILLCVRPNHRTKQHRRLHQDTHELRPGPFFAPHSISSHFNKVRREYGLPTINFSSGRPEDPRYENDQENPHGVNTTIAVGIAILATPGQLSLIASCSPVCRQFSKS